MDTILVKELVMVTWTTCGTLFGHYTVGLPIVDGLSGCMKSRPMTCWARSVAGCRCVFLGIMKKGPTHNMSQVDATFGNATDSAYSILSPHEDKQRAVTTHL